MAPPASAAASGTSRGQIIEVGGAAASRTRNTVPIGRPAGMQVAINVGRRLRWSCRTVATCTPPGGGAVT